MLCLSLPVTGFPLESVTLTTDWVTGFPLASKKVLKFVLLPRLHQKNITDIKIIKFNHQDVI